MKNWIIIILLIILATSVNAKCGDNFCDVDEDCESCPDDCLCTKGPHNEQIDCCNDFACQECQKGYCNQRKCDSLAGFISMFNKISCSKNGAVSIEVEFLELDSVDLDPEDELKVYMKTKDGESSFSEVAGTWMNPEKSGSYKYTKISGTSTFTSEENIFQDKGDYYVRVKYKIGRGDNLYETTEVNCLGMPKAEPEIPEKTETEPEEVESPREEYVEESTEEVTEETTEELEIIPIETPEKKSNVKWYIITIAIFVVLIILFIIRYEIKITKKNSKI
ncbi:MAG: hypothetical protein KKA79_05190 [Nanoarchaeota archaeon]|nr:hypothetical protein [Nanoarchaeota archaeon]